MTDRAKGIVELLEPLRVQLEQISLQLNIQRTVPITYGELAILSVSPRWARLTLKHADLTQAIKDVFPKDMDVSVTQGEYIFFVRGTGRGFGGFAHDMAVRILKPPTL